MTVSWNQGEVALGFFFCYFFHSRIGKILAESPKPDIVVAFTTATSTKFQQPCRYLTLKAADVLSHCFTPTSPIPSSLALQLFIQISNIFFTLAVSNIFRVIICGWDHKFKNWSCHSRKNDRRSYTDQKHLEQAWKNYKEV